MKTKQALSDASYLRLKRVCNAQGLPMRAMVENRWMYR